MQFFFALLCVSSVALARPAEEPVAIVSQESDILPDGHYHHSFEAANGIRASEDGEQRSIENEQGNVARGEFSYIGDDGQTYTITYIADENGFQPQGAHLPVAPPVPEPIARALAYLATAPPPTEK